MCARLVRIDITNFTEEQARNYLETLRWPTGPVCPHCGATTVYTLKQRPKSRRTVRRGLYKCKICRKQFTVTVGTVLEHTHLSLSKWLLAVGRVYSSEKGINVQELRRLLGVTYKSAWLIARKIKHAMNQSTLDKKPSTSIEEAAMYRDPNRITKPSRVGTDKLKPNLPHRALTNTTTNAPQDERLIPSDSITPNELIKVMLSVGKLPKQL